MFYPEFSNDTQHFQTKQKCRTISHFVGKHYAFYNNVEQKLREFSEFQKRRMDFKNVPESVFLLLGYDVKCHYCLFFPVSICTQMSNLSISLMKYHPLRNDIPPTTQSRNTRAVRICLLNKVYIISARLEHTET